MLAEIPQTITRQNFRRYGTLIGYPGKEKKGAARNLWRVVHRAPNSNGWRVAYLILRDKSIGRLECHPTSDETFEPVRGRALIFVAAGRQLADIACFRLDTPVIVHKGIWHGLITETAEAEIKITENLNISCRTWPWGFRIKSLKELNKKRMAA
ncbi:MAG: ureidoglycolate lyase [Candidatus Omnitrophica bacterium]|nr:ureidoglycolate lyase [Candidatus Omnitrophota bacterium]